MAERNLEKELGLGPGLGPHQVQWVLLVLDSLLQLLAHSQGPRVCAPPQNDTPTPAGRDLTSLLQLD